MPEMQKYSALNSSLLIYGYVQMALQVGAMGLGIFIFMVKDCALAGAFAEGIYVLYLSTIILTLFFNHNGTSGNVWIRNLLNLFFAILAVSALAASGFYYYYFKVVSKPNVFDILYKEYEGITILFIVYNIVMIFLFLAYCLMMWNLIGNTIETAYMMVPADQLQNFYQMNSIPQVQIEPEEKPLASQTPMFFIQN
jgi:hypothetical protein